jgi:uncharacterized metal-binding protein
MTKEERAEKSRLRAEEHQRRKRNKMFLFIAGIVLYAVVPLLWNGAVEFGWVKPIRNPEFLNSLQVARLVAIGLIVFNLDIITDGMREKAKQNKDKQASNTPATT